MNDYFAVTLANGDHFVCVVVVLVMFSVSVAAILRERRAENRLSRRTTERDELAIANANLLEERAEWKMENVRLRKVIANHASDMAMMRLAWDVDIKSGLSLGHVEATDYFIRSLDDECVRQGFASGVDLNGGEDHDL